MPPPFVSVVIPCRNESQFIGRCLQSLLNSEYAKDRLEILVVDGRSTDGSSALLNKWGLVDERVKLLDNPKERTACALNIGVQEARGDVIVVMSAHSACSPSFVLTAVRALESTEAMMVGGPIVTCPGADTNIGRAIALVLSHRFGVGNSAFRTVRRAGYVDTVPFATCRRSLFAEVGGFDERFLRNSDNDFAARVLAHGGRIYSSPDLATSYCSPGTLGAFIKQAWRTGRWNVLTVSMNRLAMRLRHFAPLCFVVSLLVATLLSLVASFGRVALAVVLGLYAAGALAAAIQIGRSAGAGYIVYTAPLFFLYHLTYGTSSLVAIPVTLVRMLFYRDSG
jgi:glycosyltransferase involved in cell wall biosynthesis